MTSTHFPRAQWAEGGSQGTDQGTVEEIGPRGKCTYASACLGGDLCSLSGGGKGQPWVQRGRKQEETPLDSRQYWATLPLPRIWITSRWEEV